MTYYINTTHGFVRGTRFVHNKTGLHVFENTQDVRLAKPFESLDEAQHYMDVLVGYVGHYSIVVPVDAPSDFVTEVTR